MNARDNFHVHVGTQSPLVSSSTHRHLICLNCFGDHSLRPMAKSADAWGACSACGKAGHALPLERIASELDKAIKTLYYGSFPAEESDDCGSDLRSIVREVLDGEHAWEDAIIEALKKSEKETCAQGTFYTDTAQYQKRDRVAADQRQ